MSKDRSFGALASVLFLCIGLAPLWKRGGGTTGGGIQWWAAAAGLLIALIAAALPSVLYYPRRAWMLLGSSLGRVVNPIILAILFFGVIAPLGLLQRMFGRDALRLKPVPAARSHWRTPQPQPMMTDPF